MDLKNEGIGSNRILLLYRSLATSPRMPQKKKERNGKCNGDGVLVEDGNGLSVRFTRIHATSKQ